VVCMCVVCMWYMCVVCGVWCGDGSGRNGVCGVGAQSPEAKGNFDKIIITNAKTLYDMDQDADGYLLKHDIIKRDVLEDFFPEKDDPEEGEEDPNNPEVSDPARLPLDPTPIAAIA